MTKLKKLWYTGLSIVGIPIVLLYEVGVLVSKNVERKQKKQ